MDLLWIGMFFVFIYIFIAIISIISLTYDSKKHDKEIMKGIKMENKIREELLKHVQEENKEYEQ